MKKFLEIFDNRNFDSFIDRMYILMENINNKYDVLKEKFPNEIVNTNSPCVSIFNILNSEKSTLTNRIKKKIELKIIFINNFLKQLKKNFINPQKDNIIFKKTKKQTQSKLRKKMLNLFDDIVGFIKSLIKTMSRDLKYLGVLPKN